MVKERTERLPIFKYNLKWLPVLSPIRAERSALLHAVHTRYRARASSFKLVWLLRYEQARGVWGHAPPGKFLN